MIKRVTAGVVTVALAALGFALPVNAAVRTISETSCGTASAFCVGLVTDTGKVDDKSFNQSAWEGAKAAAATAGGFSKYIETIDPKDYASNIDLFANKKYNVIVTVGFLMADATAAAAVKYPNIKFIGVDQFNGSPASNYSGLIFPEDKAGFLAGYLAGYLTKTKKVGAVLGTDVVPPVKRYGEGFKNGIAYAAKEQKKKIKTTIVYHAPDNAFNDPAWGATTAGQLLGQGYDVIFGAGGKTGNGALGKVAKKKGALCIGVDTDQWLTVPEAQPCLVTSAMKLLANGVSSLVAQAKAGSMKGGNFMGAIGIAPFHALSKVVPAAVAKKVKALTAKVLNGTVKTGVKA
jgi:basic membrane protein A